MEETQTSSRTGEPLTQAEREQARYALGELALSECGPDTLSMPQKQLDAVRSFFELVWALGVRTGHTAPAVAGVPVDQATVTRAFKLLSEQMTAGQHSGPALWQKVDYHGSVTQRHGAYWVYAIHEQGDPFDEEPELRYDLCEMRGVRAVSVVTNVRRSSLTPLPEYRTTV
ncbi:hypothetical protein [Streptomyces brasiliensis]|uniref:Uncharacterized protein n=1 Tax=Streptomyces brasiliensis TaxID=1954 RepID=A0A917P9W3_9ACTN|nr:hypothetical protein [Streptomyces brasiliensis]GGJ68065.1 hypothetical protein GCM10010121_093480 [Streptomyces brasiliensis]